MKSSFNANSDDQDDDEAFDLNDDVMYQLQQQLAAAEQEYFHASQTLKENSNHNRHGSNDSNSLKKCAENCHDCEQLKAAMDRLEREKMAREGEIGIVRENLNRLKSENDNLKVRMGEQDRLKHLEIQNSTRHLTNEIEKLKTQLAFQIQERSSIQRRPPLPDIPLKHSSKDVREIGVVTDLEDTEKRRKFIPLPAPSTQDLSFGILNLTNCLILLEKDGLLVNQLLHNVQTAGQSMESLFDSCLEIAAFALSISHVDTLLSSLKLSILIAKLQTGPDLLSINLEKAEILLCRLMSTSLTCSVYSLAFHLIETCSKQLRNLNPEMISSFCSHISSDNINVGLKLLQVMTETSSNYRILCHDITKSPLSKITFFVYKTPHLPDPTKRQLLKFITKAILDNLDNDSLLPSIIASTIGYLGMILIDDSQSKSAFLMTENLQRTSHLRWIRDLIEMMKKVASNNGFLSDIEEIIIELSAEDPGLCPVTIADILRYSQPF